MKKNYRNYKAWEIKDTHKFSRWCSKFWIAVSIRIIFLRRLNVEKSNRAIESLAKDTKGIFRPKTFLKDVFGFPEHYESATNIGLGYRLKKITDTYAENHNSATVVAKEAIKVIFWYVKKCTPDKTQQRNLLKTIVSRIPMELNLMTRSVFQKNMNAQIDWRFEQGVGSKICTPFSFIVGFRLKIWLKSQEQKKHSVRQSACVMWTIICWYRIIP